MEQSQPGEGGTISYTRRLLSARFKKIIESLVKAAFVVFHQAKADGLCRSPNLTINSRPLITELGSGGEYIGVDLLKKELFRQKYAAAAALPR